MISNEDLSFLRTATYKDLLTLWRFEPEGSRWFQEGPLNDQFQKALNKRRNRLTIQEMIEISKEIGFRSLPERGAFDQKRTK